MSLAPRLANLAPLAAFALLGVGVVGCAPAQVSFTCDEGEPLCDLVAIMNDDRPEATGIDLTDVYLYQASEVPLMESLVSAGEPPIPVVAGRYALFRAFVSPHEDFAPRELTGRLYLYRDDVAFAAFQVDTTINGASDEASLGSTFDFLVPGEVIVPGLSWQVSIVETTKSQGSEVEGVSSWPDGYGQPLTVTEGADMVRIMLVPVKYEADGSGRLPDTSETAVELYRQYMYSNYPAAEVEIVVGNELSWSSQVSASGSGWDGLLSAVGAARDQVGAEDDMYLYGVFEPADDFNNYCAGGCVTGLSNLVGSATDVWSRASIGVGYGGGTSAETMVHEVGHAHGRNHVDGGCGSGGGDNEYPHENGLIGPRGYDYRTGGLVDPDTTKDFMTYCSPVFVSDHQFDKLHTRVSAVSAAYYAAPGLRFDYWGLSQLSDGRLVWGPDRTLRQHPGGLTKTVELLDEHGWTLRKVEAFFAPFSDLPGGQLSFPAPGPEVAAVRVDGVVSPAR
jgi:hypothetical protein